MGISGNKVVVVSKNIAVLMGGMSSEREISKISANGVIESLTRLGHNVTPIDVNENVAIKLSKIKPDLAFNVLHGTYGEDGCIQGLLEIMKIPYTHSGLQSSAVAMDKSLTKQVLEQQGILFPKGKVASREQVLSSEVMPRPYVVKPVAEGSSVGIVILPEDDSVTIDESQLPEHCERFLVEEYIAGRELSVAVLDGKALGVIEIKPKEGFYDYENKYSDGKTEHFMPAPVPQGIYDQAMQMAAKSHQLLGCRGLTRSDFIYDEANGSVYMLEINTHPGFTPLSLAPEIAAYAGITFDELVQQLVESARCDHQ